MTSERFEAMSKRNLFDELLALRDAQRARTPKIPLIKGSELPWEVNQHGVMRWYMHPTLDDTAHQWENMFEQRIAPGSKSGRQHQQGGGVFFVLSGSGETVINDTRHSWGKGDVVQLPILSEGVTFQHFNTDTEEEARLLYTEANLAHVLGVDRGCGFEQLAEAPEYTQRLED